jgi:hypothetical protein
MLFTNSPSPPRLYVQVSTLHRVIQEGVSAHPHPHLLVCQTHFPPPARWHARHTPLHGTLCLRWCEGPELFRQLVHVGLSRCGQYRRFIVQNGAPVRDFGPPPRLSGRPRRPARGRETAGGCPGSHLRHRHRGGGARGGPRRHPQN